MSKPKGRLGKSYRIIWNDDGGMLSHYNPPITAEKVAQAYLGFYEGTPVDAYFCALGDNCGYTVIYPTKVPGMEFIVDRLQGEGKINHEQAWRYAENIRQLWKQNLDPIEIQCREARRLGIDFWLQLRMNDWHHLGITKMYSLLEDGAFYRKHPEYRIGRDGVPPYFSEHFTKLAAPLQDFAHPEVRRLRQDVAQEACERYDIDGFQYDFMRCPIYFKHGEEEKNMPLITELIRETRTLLDRIGKKKGKTLGFSVRVPSSLAGARNLGLDLPTWIKEDLVDIVVPSGFFAMDLDEDVSEWVDLTQKSAVRINPAIEEAYLAGHTGGVARCFYSPPVMLPLSLEMINALAARYWKNGADGFYLFNWMSTAGAFNFDNRAALDDIGNPLRLKYKNKRYVVTRRDDNWPNCLPAEKRPIPEKLGKKPLLVNIEVADDLAEAGTRMKNVFLHLNLANLSVQDRIEVQFNGKTLSCLNPLTEGAYRCAEDLWQNYDLSSNLPRCGDNELSLRLVKRNERLAEELSIEVSDIELSVEYHYPNGPWVPPLEYAPRA